MADFHLRRYQPPTPPEPKRRYGLAESVNGGAFVPCKVVGGQMDSYSPHVLAHWLAARCWYWQAQGYTRLFTGTVNQVTALKPNSRDGVIVRLVEVEEAI